MTSSWYNADCDTNAITAIGDFCLVSICIYGIRTNCCFWASKLHISSAASFPNFPHYGVSFTLASPLLGSSLYTQHWKLMMWRRVILHHWNIPFPSKKRGGLPHSVIPEPINYYNCYSRQRSTLIEWVISSFLNGCTEKDDILKCHIKHHRLCQVGYLKLLLLFNTAAQLPNAKPLFPKAVQSSNLGYIYMIEATDEMHFNLQVS